MIDDFYFKDDDFPAVSNSIAKSKDDLSPVMQSMYNEIQFFRVAEVAESALNLRFFD